MHHRDKRRWAKANAEDGVAACTKNLFMQQQQRCGNSRVTASSAALMAKNTFRLLKLEYASDAAKNDVTAFICSFVCRSNWPTQRQSRSCKSHLYINSNMFAWLNVLSFLLFSYLLQPREKISAAEAPTAQKHFRACCSRKVINIRMVTVTPPSSLSVLL